MTEHPKKKAAAQADLLHLRGMQIVAGCRAAPDAETLRVVAELWQKAWKLYRRIGDETKAAQLKVSLVELYKRRFTAMTAADSTIDAAKEFTDWAMFAKIGCFGFGGPMAIFSLLEDELVRRKKILSGKEFLEGAVLGDVLPGPVTMDIVTYAGFKLRKWRGAAIATLVFILPSFIIMIALAMLYDKYSITPTVKRVLGCLGAAVTGLVLSVGLKLTKEQVRGFREVCILIWSMITSLVFKLDIVPVVLVGALLGVLLFRDEPDELDLPR